MTVKDFVMVLPFIIALGFSLFGLYHTILVFGWWLLIFPAFAGIYVWGKYSILYFKQKAKEKETQDASV